MKTLLLLPVVLYSAIQACMVNERILGGEYAKEGEFPEVVFLQVVVMNGSLPRSSICGGSLISEHWVLTAAHCVTSVPPMKFKLVVVYPTRNYPKSIPSTDVIVHENYKYYSNDDDIALIRLPQSMATIYPNFKTVSLPLQGQRLTSNEVTLVGWGLTSTTDMESDSQFLMKREHVPLNQSLCQSVHASETKALCRYPTRSTGDACQGDSGGPIFMDGLQVGIVSGAFKNASTGIIIARDVRVSGYRDWIDTHAIESRTVI